MITPERTYVDSNVLIYAIEGPADLALRAKELLNFHNEAGNHLFSSEITLGECLRGAFRTSDDLARTYIDLLSDARGVTLEPVSLALIKRAAVLGAEFNMKLIDAIHVATAEALRCAVFLTNDRGMRAPPGIEIRRLGGPV